jgi:hypothetical protein
MARFAPHGVAPRAPVLKHEPVALRSNRLAVRLVSLLALIGMAALGAPGRAQAAPSAERPEVRISSPARVVTVDGGTKRVPIQVSNLRETPVTGLVLDFASAAAPIDPRIGFQPPPGCTVTGCAVGDLGPYGLRQYAYTVQPTPDLPAAGASFDVSVHDAGGRWRESVTVTVVPNGQSFDLEVAGPPVIRLKPGKSAVMPISVRNSGTRPTAGLVIEASGEAWLEWGYRYSNCSRGPETGFVCAFDVALAPGAVYVISPSTPLTVGVGKTVPGPATYSGGMRVFSPVRPADVAVARAAIERPGTKLELVPVTRTLDYDYDPSELNGFDNVAAIRVEVPLNPADSVAIGDTFEGRVGDARTVEVGIRNDGPAISRRPGKSWKPSAKVRIPSGLKLTEVDENCVPNGDGEPSWDRPGQVSGHDYLCVGPEDGLSVAEQHLFSFTAVIEDGENEEEGSITVDGGVQDLKTADNEAKIDVKLTTAVGSAGGGGLPITGTPTTHVTVAGLLLVLLGACTMILTRRGPAGSGKRS